MANRPRAAAPTNPTETYDPRKGVEYLRKATGLGRDTVYAAIRSGELPGNHVGDRYIVPEEAFRAFCRGEWIPIPHPVLSKPAKATTVPTFLHSRKEA
jgi:excisionase family DNA binding protein